MLNTVQKNLGYRELVYNVKTDEFFMKTPGDNYAVVDIAFGQTLGLPRGSSDERPTDPQVGDIFWDVDTGSMVIWDGLEWVSMGGGDPGTSGINWKAGPELPSYDWTGLAYGGGAFVITSANNEVMYSIDGTHWIAVQPPQNNSWGALTFGGGQFVAVAQSGNNRVMTSPDGRTWTLAPPVDSYAWKGITYGNGRYVAVAEGRAMYSDDGISWTSVAVGANKWMGVAYGRGKFVATAKSGSNRIMYSSDGVSWTQTAAADETADCRAITFGNPSGSISDGRFVTVSVGGTNRASYSDDGINWTATDATSEDYWYGVAYGDNKFVAVSSGPGSNRVMYSDDGVNWTATQGDQDTSGWRAVAYGRNMFIASAAAGSDNSLMYSIREAL